MPKLSLPLPLEPLINRRLDVLGAGFAAAVDLYERGLREPYADSQPLLSWL